MLVKGCMGMRQGRFAIPVVIVARGQGGIGLAQPHPGLLYTAVSRIVMKCVVHACIIMTLLKESLWRLVVSCEVQHWKIMVSRYHSW